MARTPRQVERVEFDSGEIAPIVAWMARLAGAGDGWINLVPKIAGRDERPTSLRPFTLFSGDGTGLTMCTWVPGRRGRRKPILASLGITHVAGRRVVPELRSLMVPVPANWTVRQDNPRRGLVLRVPVEEPAEEVLAWALRAVAALAPGPVERWRADIHLPGT